MFCCTACPNIYVTVGQGCIPLPSPLRVRCRVVSGSWWASSSIWLPISYCQFASTNPVNPSSSEGPTAKAPAGLSGLRGLQGSVAEQVVVTAGLTWPFSLHLLSASIAPLLYLHVTFRDSVLDGWPQLVSHSVQLLDNVYAYLLGSLATTAAAVVVAPATETPATENAVVISPAATLDPVSEGSTVKPTVTEPALMKSTCIRLALTFNLAATSVLKLATKVWRCAEPT
jgi:hypothetical protein